MTKEDIAFIIRTKWDGLLQPAWPRKLLIAFGTAIHDKIPLSKMEPEQLNALLPFLSIVAEYMGKHLAGRRAVHITLSQLKAGGANKEILEESEKLFQPSSLSREETAYYIRTMWDSLLKPNWPKDDLIDLGMAVFTKTTLAKIDQRKLGKLLPNLSIAAEWFGQQTASRFAKRFDPFLASLTPAPPAAATTSGDITPTATVQPESVVATPVVEPLEQVVDPPIAEPLEPVVEPPAVEPTPVQETIVEKSYVEQPSEDPPSEEQPPVEPQGENNG